MFFKKYNFDMTILVFVILSVMLAKFNLPCKKILSLVLVSFLIYQAFRCRSRVKTQFMFFFKPDNQKGNSISGLITYFAILSFIASIYFLGAGFILSARWSLLSFFLFSLFMVFFSFFEFDDSVTKKIKDTRWIFAASIPLIYSLVSTLSSSVFLQIASIDISLSPWLSFLLKMVFFIVVFSMFFQLVVCVLFFYMDNNLNKCNGIKYLVFLCAVALIMNALILWVGNLAYYSIDNGVKFEWRTTAFCHGNVMKNEGNYYYFGFNTEKYIAYHSDDKFWYFDELTCYENDKNEYDFKKINISTNKVTRWFHN
ncbi:hypothetical protein [Rouxiella sp. Mn2063]|uniref:hypothetical protein n=1 Tax=Rouxiella sp. Mn2063 TaxID=3395262 RepID=UPI003BE67540